MSFLTDDAKAALEQRFNELQQTNEVPQVQNEHRVETRADETEVQNKTDVKKDVEVSSTNNKEEQGHAVPYQRFKEVNESKKALKLKNAELEKQLNEIRSKKEDRTERVDNTSAFKEFDDFYNSVMADEPEDKYQSLEKRLQTFETRAAQASLEAEIFAINKKYPEVPETVLLQACINNADADLVQVAKEYSQFIAEIEEKALAKHFKKAPDAPSRKQSSGSSSVQAPTQPPRNFVDAKQRALQFLKQQGL